MWDGEQAGGRGCPLTQNRAEWLDRDTPLCSRKEGPGQDAEESGTLSSVSAKLKSRPRLLWAGLNPALSTSESREGQAGQVYAMAGQSCSWSRWESSAQPSRVPKV